MHTKSIFGNGITPVDLREQSQVQGRGGIISGRWGGLHVWTNPASMLCPGGSII